MTDTNNILGENMLPLADIAKPVFNITPRIAQRKAATNTLPVPAFRIGGTPTGPAGWYAVVVCRDENEGMFPSASFWNGSSWGEDQRPIVAFHGPHPSEEAAKDWAYEHDPEI